MSIQQKFYDEKVSLIPSTDFTIHRTTVRTIKVQLKQPSRETTIIQAGDVDDRRCLVETQDRRQHIAKKEDTGDVLCLLNNEENRLTGHGDDFVNIIVIVMEWSPRHHHPVDVYKKEERDRLSQPIVVGRH